MKCSTNWYNPLLSVILNFYYLPFKQARRLPIACYGWPHFISMHGNIIIETEDLYFKMIRLNVTQHNPYNSCGTFEYVNDGGSLIFQGSAVIMSGSRIMLYSVGRIVIGTGCYICSCCNVGCQEEIVIGEDVIIAAGTTIYDTDFHYKYNIKKQSVKDIHSKIVIGDRVWLCTRSYLSKGTIIPKGCIVSANTVISRPLGEIKEYSIIAGSPAKVVAEGYIIVRGALEEELLEKFLQSDCGELLVQYEI